MYIGSIEKVKSVSFTACTYGFLLEFGLELLHFIYFVYEKKKYTDDSEIIQGFIFDKTVIIYLRRLINNGCKW